MENYEDVIIGNSFFMDQIYKIDYENSILILYGKPPEIETAFLKQDMILDSCFYSPTNYCESTISDGVITLEKQKKNGSDYKFGGLIGNKILKRFNVIIDNREGVIYLKPNFF